jgi:II/X family phage/plasmid replication protein
MSPVYQTTLIGIPMAIDTVKLRSPSIDEGTASFLERQCILKQGVELSSGEILYEITTGSLEGSWDSRIAFKVHREDWVTDCNGKLQQVPCKPFVVVEASYHKFFHGQNIYGNPTGFQELSRLFINLVGEMLADDSYSAIEKANLLPDPAKWEVRRVDWAEMFRLSPEAQKEFFRALKNCKFPRRALKEAKYDTAVHFPGKFTTLRIYGKGAEFKEHDFGRLRHSLVAYAMRQNGDIDYDQEFGQRVYGWVEKKSNALQRLANNRLRAEVQINADKLHHDFDGRYPLVSEIDDDYLINIFNDQMFKLLREGRSAMETVRTCNQVWARLDAVYGDKTAKSLHSFWVTLAGQGEEVVRERFSKSQFYANRKKLVDAGVSWLSSDVFIVPQETALPLDFKPLSADPRRCVGKVSANSIFNFCPVEQYGLRKAA